MRTPVLLALIAAAIVMVAVLRVDTGSSGRVSGRGGSRPTARAPAGQGELEELEEADPLEEREASAPRADRPRASTGAELPTLPAADEVRVRFEVAERDGDPVAGVRVVEVDRWAPDRSARWDGACWGITDEAGRLERTVPAAEVLHRRIRFQGRKEGYASGQVELHVQHPGSALLDRTGRFELERIDTGAYLVGATRSGARFAWSAPLAVGRGETREVPGLVRPAPRPDERPALVGRVLTPDGEPASGVTVAYAAPLGRSGVVSSGADGRFEVRGRPGERVELVATCREPGAGEARGFGIVGAGSVELRLAPQPVLVARLVLPDGVVPRQVVLRLRNGDEEVVGEHSSFEAEVTRLRWPPEAVFLEATVRLPHAPSARVRLPHRPLAGDVEVELDLSG